MFYFCTHQISKYINAEHFFWILWSVEIEFKKNSLRATRSQSSPNLRNSSLLQPEVSSHSCLSYYKKLNLLSFGNQSTLLSLLLKVVCRAKWRTTSRETEAWRSLLSTGSRYSRWWRKTTQRKWDRYICLFTRLVGKGDEWADCEPNQ